MGSNLGLIFVANVMAFHKYEMELSNENIIKLSEVFICLKRWLDFKPSNCRSEFSDMRLLYSPSALFNACQAYVRERLVMNQLLNQLEIEFWAINHSEWIIFIYNKIGSNIVCSGFC